MSIAGIEELRPMAKLNRKKKAQDVRDNLTQETKARFVVHPSSSGKVMFFDRPTRRFTIKDMR